jgi:hypothetical protein
MNNLKNVVRIRWLLVLFYTILLAVGVKLVTSIKEGLTVYILLIGITVGSNILSLYIKPKEDISFALLGLDTLVITLAIYYTGGIESPLYLLYLFPISCSLFFSISSKRLLLISMLAYGGAVLLEKMTLVTLPISSGLGNRETVGLFFLRAFGICFVTGLLISAIREKESQYEKADRRLKSVERRFREEMKMREEFFHKEFKESDFILHNLEENYHRMVRALVQAREAQDPFTKGHSERVAEYSAKIAEEMNLSQKERDLIENTARIHDVGRAGIPEAMFNKPDVLNDEEFELIKSHAVRSEHIASPISSLYNGLPYIRNHHERFNGTGYPDRLKGEEIPLGARIIAVADAFCAMTARRAYRRRMSTEVALEELRKNAGKQHDPKVVQALVNIVAREKEEELAEE